MLEKILKATHSRLSPLQFEHIITSFFLCIGHMILQFQSSGMISVVQNVYIINWYICSTKSGLAFFISSACIRSILGVLFSLSFCMAFSTSFNAGVVSSISEYAYLYSCLVTFWLRNSLFNSSSKCSAHHLSIPSSSLRSVPSLFRHNIFLGWKSFLLLLGYW
jgi:hypothetical protein